MDPQYWTAQGACICYRFAPINLNEWQSFRTRRDRNIDLVSATHTYPAPGRYVIAVKVIDIFGNDTMKLVPINVPN